MLTLYVDGGLQAPAPDGAVVHPLVPTAPPVSVYDADLAAMGYSVLRDFHVAVCVSCAHAVSADDLQAHAASHGINTIGDRPTNAAILRHGLLNSNIVKKPPFGRAPVALLSPPVEGFYCKICVGDPTCVDYACIKRRTFNEHIAEKHKEYAGHGAQFLGKAPVQYLFPFRGHKNVFVVDPTLLTPSSVKSPADTLVDMADAAKPLREERILAEPADVRNITAFLYETGFSSAVVGANPYQLAALLALPGQTEAFYDVAQAVAGYFRHVAEDVTKTLSTYNLRCIRAKKEGCVFVLITFVPCSNLLVAEK